ncbi:MAG: hypothetical protein QMD53_01355 [Actinomycetota bacterium]|nr:hypothetical protein [Actinomycetota bacterium]
MKSLLSANSGELGKELLNLVSMVVTLSHLEEGEKTDHVIGVHGERGVIRDKERLGYLVEVEAEDLKFEFSASSIEIFELGSRPQEDKPS